MKIWRNLTQDANGHYIGKDTFKTLAFIGGFAIIVGAAITSGFGIHMEIAGGVFLLGLAFGLQGLKGAEQYFQRKTADTAGNPLATPESVLPPSEDPVLMPQGSEKCADVETDK